jgi:hypothetical protein
MERGNTSISRVLDLTAAARLLCYLLTGSSQRLSLQNSFLEPYEGLCRGLHEIMRRATSKEIEKRFLPQNPKEK